MKSLKENVKMLNEILENDYMDDNDTTLLSFITDFKVFEENELLENVIKDDNSNSYIVIYQDDILKMNYLELHDFTIDKLINLDSVVLREAIDKYI